MYGISSLGRLVRDLKVARNGVVLVSTGKAFHSVIVAGNKHGCAIGPERWGPFGLPFGAPEGQ